MSLAGLIPHPRDVVVWHVFPVQQVGHVVWPHPGKPDVQAGTDTDFQQRTSIRYTFYYPHSFKVGVASRRDPDFDIHSTQMWKLKELGQSVLKLQQALFVICGGVGEAVGIAFREILLIGVGL